MTPRGLWIGIVFVAIASCASNQRSSANSATASNSQPSAAPASAAPHGRAALVGVWSARVSNDPALVGQMNFRDDGVVRYEWRDANGRSIADWQRWEWDGSSDTFVSENGVTHQRVTQTIRFEPDGGVTITTPATDGGANGYDVSLHRVNESNAWPYVLRHDE